ncbi:MAG TPA: HAD family hydrolase [Desulfobacteria bacterium]|nr:HAD family hydrolase [Desulfobacteria bacterium]
MTTRKIEALLFDLDGVLIDSFESWYQAFAKMLKAYGKDEMSRETFRETYWGPGLGHNLATLQLDENAADYCVREQIKLIELIALFPGAKEVLRRTKQDYKLKVGLVTNTPRANVTEVFERFRLTNHFDAILTGDDVKRGKPDAEIVLKACEQLNVQPEHAVLVGDTRTDYQAGKAAGCFVVGVGGNSAGDVHIEKLHELFSVLH